MSCVNCIQLNSFSSCSGLSMLLSEMIICLTQYSDAHFYRQIVLQSSHKTCLTSMPSSIQVLRSALMISLRLITFFNRPALSVNPTKKPFYAFISSSSMEYWIQSKFRGRRVSWQIAFSPQSLFMWAHTTSICNSHKSPISSRSIMFDLTVKSP